MQKPLLSKTPDEEWKEDSPGSQGFDPQRLNALWGELEQRRTNAFLLIRNDRIVFERYAPDYSRTVPHFTASLAKSVVGGLSLMRAMDKGCIHPDDRASQYIPEWAEIPGKRDIMIRHLASHTSGIEDAESDALPHDLLPGWKGEFWQRLPPPRDPFTLSRDAAPVMEPPGVRFRYSNPGMAMLSYAVTASLRGAPQENLRDLLRVNLWEPLGIPEREVSVGYGETTRVNGLDLVACWGGGNFSPNALARIGQFLLHGGQGDGPDLISPATIRAATTYAGSPGRGGLAWWTNEGSGGLRWKAAPKDAFWGSGAGHQILLVIPSLNVIAVRNGRLLDDLQPFDLALESCFATPLMESQQ